MRDHITVGRRGQAKVIRNYMSEEPALNQPPSPGVKAADAYHHGDLRAALIVAAREALEVATPNAITLKSLAARLGVSQPAPYRHFENREALLAAVAADGFERFRAELARAGEDAPDAEKFERSCLAYIAFGHANLGVYRLMFASRLLPTSDDAALGRAGSAAFDFLLDGLSRYAPPERLQATAIWVWSTLHGLVMLEAEGLLSGPAKKAVSAGAVVHEMVRGLTAAQQVP
jgi:AcrR family transcriptional regulator